MYALNHNQHEEALAIADGIELAAKASRRHRQLSPRDREGHQRSVCARYTFACVMGFDFNPEIGMWIQSRNLLTGPDGTAYFIKVVRDLRSPMHLAKWSLRWNVVYVHDYSPAQTDHDFLGWFRGDQMQECWLNNNSGSRDPSYVVPPSSEHSMEELLPARRAA